MGSYKWGYKSPNAVWVTSIVTLLRTLCVTTHEPPSRLQSWEGSGLLIRG